MGLNGVSGRDSTGFLNRNRLVDGSAHTYIPHRLEAKAA